MYKQQEAGYYEPLEFGKTTVYKRKDPTFYKDGKEVTAQEFGELTENKRVTYLEKQLTYREYYMELEEENERLKQKTEMQDMVVQDLMFNVLPTLGGQGGE